MLPSLSSFSLFLVVTTILLVRGVVIRPYNYVSYTVFDTFAELAATYLHHEDDEHFTNTNLFLGVADPECWDKLQSPAFLGAQRHGGGNVSAVALLPRSEFPGETTECAQVFYYNIYSPFREPADVCSSFEHIELNSFMARSLRISDVRFTNNFQYAINVFWHEENTEPMSNGRLDPGQSMTVSTFVGHIFAANAEQEDGSFAPYTNIIDFVVMDGSNYKFNEHNRLETCEVAPGSKGMFSKVSANPEDVISCDDMHTRLVEFTHQVWHDKRMGLNFVQPQLVRPVTDLGFEIRKLPEETYTWLKTWYDEQQRLAEELEGGAGPCMNQQVAPSAITHLTPEYKDRLSEDLQAMLEEWFGGELSLTSIYGVRKYVNGSVLRMHVDTVNTHVVSAIINVDQDVDQDWPLVILDHEDNEHQVIMQKGDMLLYESAKLLHGRPATFVGKHYDNIFIHYKPIDGWDYSWM